MYKALNSDLISRKYQFEIGQTYEIEEGVEFEFEFCLDMQDCFYQHDMDSRICEVKAEGIFRKEEGKRICRKITIIRELPKQEIMDKITGSRIAYLWAKDIGNKDVMIDRVTESKWAYRWAMEIGNRDVMLPRITDERQRGQIEKNMRIED